MAITKSAKKAIRQSERRNKQNTFYKDKMRALIKEAKALIVAKKNDEAKKILPQIYAILDKSAKVGLIKKNNASRRKSRLTKLIEKK